MTMIYSFHHRNETKREFKKKTFHSLTIPHREFEQKKIQTKQNKHLEKE